MISTDKTTTLAAGARGALVLVRRAALISLISLISPPPTLFVHAAPPALSPPPALALLSGGVPTELVAEEVEWDEPRGALSARGVRLTQRPAAGGALTLTCAEAALRFSALRGEAPSLASVELRGGVRLEGSEGALEAGGARWEEGGALSLTGGVRGEWRGQRVEATRASVDLRARRLTLSGVRARLSLPALSPASLAGEGRGAALPPRR